MNRIVFSQENFLLESHFIQTAEIIFGVIHCIPAKCPTFLRTPLSDPEKVATGLYTITINYYTYRKTKLLRYTSISMGYAVILS